MTFTNVALVANFLKVDSLEQLWLSDILDYFELGPMVQDYVA